MRGHLKCIKCGGNLTGSNSTSKTGAKHSYYHCNPNKGCNERFKLKDAHTAIKALLKDLNPGEEVCELFGVILEDHYKTLKNTKFHQIKTTEESISNLEARKKKLLDKLLDQVISNEDYKIHNSNIDQDLAEKRQELLSLNDYQKDLREYIKFGLTLMQNVDAFYELGDVSIKSKLMSSIFAEKIEFDGEKYRTPIFKEGFGYIYSKTKELEFEITKMGTQLSKDSHLVPLTVPLSNSFYQNLTDIYSLKELLYNTGIADYNGLPLVKPNNRSDLLLPQGY